MSFHASQFLGRSAGMFAAAVVLASTLTAQVSEQVILNFSGYNGIQPQSPLLQDASGHLYGTALGGGDKSSACPGGCGVVFELAPKTGGGWNYRRLYSFTGNNDFLPEGRLVFDAAGNLYGIAAGNGITAGEVFRLSRASNGQWTESIIHAFGGSGDGAAVRSGLIIDSAGNLYGTTAGGGANANQGTAYKLSPNSDGTWTETVLYSFGGQANDGFGPFAEVIQDAAGNLYGTTENGGAFGWGTVFELSPNSGGGWTETVLYSFTGHQDQGHPQASLWMDATGNLFSTTFGNTIHGDGLGTVFELVHKSDGSWGEKTLHTFLGNANNGSDGAFPGLGGLVPDKAGNLYGTTEFGGSTSGGVIYKMTSGTAGWTESILYTFQICCSGNSTGAEPFYGVTFGKSSGILFGTASHGGSAEDGVVYEITP